MKQYILSQSFEIFPDKVYIPGSLVIYYHKQMNDADRIGIKENYLFDGLSINFLIFELKIGVKIYEVI